MVAFVSAPGSTSPAYPQITNPRGLRRWKAAYDACLFSPAIVDVRGDSIAAGVGVENTGDVVNNDASALKGWSGQLATRFAGLTGIGEGGLITPQFPGTGDIRVTKAGTTNINSTGPMNSGVSATSISNAGAPGYATFAVPVSTQVDLLVYQSSNGAPTTGQFKYSVDGGADVSVANTDQKYRVISITGLAATSHTVTLKGDISTAASYFFGVRHSMGKGVVVGRFARPGWTLLDAFALGSNVSLVGNASGLARIADGWGAWSPHLTVITFGHNDCGYQTTGNPSGLYSTPPIYRQHLQSAIDTITAKGSCTLLYAPQLPPAQTPPAGGEDFLAYHAVMKSLAHANDHVAFLDAHDRAGSVAEALATGFYSAPSTVHPSVAGYGVMSQQVFDALTHPSIVAAG